MAIKKFNIIALFICFTILTAIYPLAIIPCLALAGVWLMSGVALTKINHFLFYGIIIAAFFGSYLSIPALPNIFLFRILLFLHFILFLFEKKDWQRFRNLKMPFICFACWVLYSLVTLIWSQDISLSLRAIYFQFESFYLIILVVYYIRSFSDLEKLFKVILPIFILAVLVGCYETITGSHLFYSTGVTLGNWDHRPTGFLFNTNDYSSFLSMYFPIAIYFLLKKINFLRVGLSLLCGGVVFYLVIATESRTGLVAFAVVTLIIIVKSFHKVIVGFVFFILSCFIGIYALLAPYTTNIDLAYFTEKEASTDQRVLIYETLLNLIKENHFLGVGMGVVPKYIFTQLYGTVNIPANMQQTMGAHNFFLANLADVGIIGVCFFLLFFLWLSYQSIKTFFKKKALVYSIPLSVIITFLTVSVGSSSIFEMRVVWIGLGIALVIIQLYLKERNSENEKKVG
ncbi:O-antigen ligase [Listeria sp. PSOL-1]|uniref:O-antigen ligase family protein n=1 Tax=Listeria sp. PSOL-1 TaxID=1844999 RepID=UPI0013D448AD|nr:O-antigen ligase family protein [Listeria sp. PSOL-1]